MVECVAEDYQVQRGDESMYDYSSIAINEMFGSWANC